MLHVPKIGQLSSKIGTFPKVSLFVYDFVKHRSLRERPFLSLLLLHFSLLYILEMAKTTILKINPERIEADKIKRIAGVLKKDGIIAYPTDTFYGLGACCLSENAVRKIYQIKRRKPSKPLSILISDLEMVQKVAAEIPPLFRKMADKFWPGPLTLVLKASPELPKNLLGPGDSIGIRLPALLWLKKLVKESGFPITATSANISGERESADPEKIMDSFCGKVDLFVDGGKLCLTLPSTVINLTSRRPEILREGAVPYSHLKRYLER